MVRAIPPSLEDIGTRLTGTAVGLVFAVGEIGGFAGPFLIGLLRDATGSFLPGLAVLAAGGIAAVFAGYRLNSVSG
jgi:cyanate permease